MLKLGNVTLERMKISQQKGCATLQNTAINRSWKGMELGRNWGIWENNKNNSVSDIRAQSLEQSEEMRSEHRPGESLGRCFQKKSGDVPAFVLIRSHLEEKLNTSISRENPLREPLL